jgi:hypothetical protein
MAEATQTQQDPMKAEPQQEHEWLQKLVGEWTYETEAAAEPAKASEKISGTESVRSLGGIWVLAEGQGEMPGGGQATTLFTLGYDPQEKRYVGTWIGSMMTHLWVYDGGGLDASEKVLTLESEGPSMDGEGKTARYKDIIEFKNDDHRVLTAFVRGQDGEWSKMMTVNYRRKK